MADVFLITRGVAFGLVLLLCIKAWRDNRQVLSGRLLLMLFACLGVYLLMPFLAAFPRLFYLMVIPAILVPPFFWLFSLSVFQDWDRQGVSVGRVRQTVIVIFLVVSYGSFWLSHQDNVVGQAPDSPASFVLFYLSYLFRIAFLVLALVAVMTQWQQDLVETRRRLRSVVITVTGVYILAVLCAELMLRGEAAPLVLEVGHSIALTLLLLVACSVLLLGSGDFLLDTMRAPAADSPTLTSTDQDWLANLEQHMEGDFGYHDCELTIRKLGELLSIPEHRLRLLINRHLGYRNFNDYLNHYRIAEAASRLVDPQQERLPILSIALEVGYASLPPFIRAFKARHQQTPGEYRRRGVASI